jgi:chromosome segregation ATPase
MAPKGRKRASTGSAEQAEKVAKKAIAIKCASVTAELGKLESLPESCRTMLVSMAEPALSTYAAERHPFQVQGVEMVAKTLAMLETELTKSIAEEAAKVSGADAEKAKRAADKAAAETKLSELEQAVTSAKETVEADSSAEKAAKADVAKAKEALKDKETEFAADTQKKMSLESARTLYDPVKTSKLEEKKSLKTIQKVMQEFDINQFLVTSIAEAAAKDVEERGTYDGIVVKHIDEKLSEWTVATEASLQAGETAKVELTTAQSSAEQQHAAAVEKLSASKTALQAATTAVQEGKSAFKEAEALVKSFDKEITAAGKKLEEVKASLESFKEGAMKAFTELKDLAPPPAPEPVPEEEPAPTAEEIAEMPPVD